MSEPPGLVPDDLHDRTLISQVHPLDWINPTPADRYNLVVIGAGTAGLVTAAGAAGLGAKVALIEKHLMGGDCLNAGCVPSKALLRSARVAADVRDAGRFGVHVQDGPSVDFPAVMERMRRLRARLSPHDSAARFAALGADVFFGEGRFVPGGRIQVGDAVLRYARAVVATGTHPIVPPIPGLQEAGYHTNETIFSLTALPRRLAVIGAGPIGCELAQAFARFGAEVWLVDRAAQVLPREDADAADAIRRALVADGVALRLNAAVKSVKAAGGDTRLAVEYDGRIDTVAVDAILLCVGRAPNVEGLGLDDAGVAHDRRLGVTVDDRLRTSNPNVYAAGDVCSRYQFTHAADALARVVIQNALFRGRAKASALTIPWCTYTDPEVAHVGVSERDAAERGVPITTYRQDLADVDRAVLDGEEHGFVKVHVRRGTDRIVGATVVARHAGEMISELTLAMVGGLGLKTLAKTIHPYPTQAEAVKRVGDAYNRARLTPSIKMLFARWLSWTR